MVYPHNYRTEHSETVTSNSTYGAYFASKSKVSITPKLLKIVQCIDSHRQQFLDNLEEIVKFKTVTTDLKYRQDLIHTIKFVEKWLNQLDIKSESFGIGKYTVNGKEVSLPPVILANIGNDPKKKTCCVYAHLDVPDPANNKWDTDPWTLTNDDNRYLYGNGAACGKGPLLMWFHIVQAFKDQNMPLPVNLKFIIESMNHQNSLGFENFVSSRSQDFLANVDLVVENGCEWIGDKYPCLVYGTVGIIDFEITIEKTENSTTEIKDDMVAICNSLENDTGKIIVNNFNDFVEQITPDEERTYENIKGFDIEEVRESLPQYKKSWDKVRLLMSYWRLPSILFDDIEECNCDKQDFSKIKRKFIVKIVPRQTVDKSETLILHHIHHAVTNLNIENKVTCKVIAKIRPWFENYYSPVYTAAAKANLQIYKENPDYIRDDAGRQTVTIFDNVLEKNVLLLPLFARGSNLGEGNENITLRNFFEGTKLMAAFLFQFAAVDLKKKKS